MEHPVQVSHPPWGLLLGRGDILLPSNAHFWCVTPLNLCSCGKVCTHKVPANFHHQEFIRTHPTMAKFPKGEHKLMIEANAARAAHWAWFGISWVPNSPVEYMVMCRETFKELASRSGALDCTFPALCNTYLFCFILILSTLYTKVWQIFSLHCMHEQSPDCQYVFRWSINILLQLLYHSWEKYCTYYHILDHCEHLKRTYWILSPQENSAVCTCLKYEMELQQAPDKIRVGISPKRWLWKLLSVEPLYPNSLEVYFIALCLLLW